MLSPFCVVSYVVMMMMMEEVMDRNFDRLIIGAAAITLIGTPPPPDYSNYDATQCLTAIQFKVHFCRSYSAYIRTN